MVSSRRRSVIGLLGSWAVYWTGLAAVKLGPPVLAIYRATRGTQADTSSVGVSFTNFVLSLIVTDHGSTTWSGSVHVVALALWIAGVPLALWFAWLYTQRSASATQTPERQRA